MSERFFEEMPKAEVHIHMDGALPKQDIWEIAQRHKIVLPEISEQSRKAIDDFYEVKQSERYDTPEAFSAFLRKFGPVIALMKGSESLRDVAAAHVHDLVKQNYVYAETRFAPQYSASSEFSLEAVIQSALDGLEQGRQETGTLVRLIVSIGRECDEATSVAVAEAALKFQDKGVVGIDLACNEAMFPPERHKRAYRETFGSGLKRTVHAGELPARRFTRFQNMLTSLSSLDADGLGHAVSLPHEPDLLSRVTLDRVRIESCPISNQMTGAINGDLRSLALDALLQRGVLVSLNTDDPLMFGAKLSDVFRATCEAYDFGPDEVKTLTRNAVLGAFCSEEEREWIFGEFERRGMKLV